MSPTTIEEREYMTHVPYASTVGGLIYAMVCTMPDLSQAVSLVFNTCMIPAWVIGKQ